MIRLSYLPRLIAGAAVFCAASLRAAAPVFPAHPDGTDSPLNVPTGKTLVIPLACDDADGDTLTYTVTSSNPHVFARVKTGNQQMKITVHSDNGGDGSPIDGVMEFQLFRDFTPGMAGFIGGYAQSGYYDNVIFHRIVPGFVVQGGDPAGTGTGVTNATPPVNLNLNYNLPHEFNSDLIFSGRGQIAMANSFGGYTYDPSFQSIPVSQSFPDDGNTRYRTASFQATNGTQFFITLAELRDFSSGTVNLDFKHTIFGQLVRGFDVLTKLAVVPEDATTNLPNVPVTMTALSVAPSKTDGILLVSATAPGTCTLKVTATDPAGNTAERDITVTVVADTVNDPPLLDPLDPVVMPVGGAPNFRVRTTDLESDAVSTRFPVIDTVTGQTIYAGLNTNNLKATARPTAGAWDVSVSVAGLNDPLTTASPYDASRFQLLEVGVGDRQIAATPETLQATAGVSTGSVRVAAYRHGGVAAQPADFIGTVIWGDGSNSDTSSGNTPTVTVLRSPLNPNVYEVRGTHTYARPGVYPLKVVIDGPLGSAATVVGSVVVSAPGATLKAAGADLEFNASPVYSGRPIATFTDTTPGARLANFSAIIDWGDGQRVPGGLRQTGVGTFVVVGSHRYQDPTRYAVTAYIHRNTPAADVTAWSSIKMGGFVGPPQLPPFAKANITSYWSGSPTKTYRGNAVDVTGTLFIINGGQKPTQKWDIKMWLSSDATLQTTGTGADTLLNIGPLAKLMTSVALNPLQPGGGGNFGFANNGANADFTIRLPAGETGAGKYVIAQLDYSDPIIDHMAVNKAIAFGPLNGIVVTSPDFNSSSTISISEGLATAPHHTATFHVKLDTLPTADVTIPLSIINSTGVADTTRATLDHTQLVFTSANGTTEQVVTVTVVDDTVVNGTGSYTIQLGAATSTDPRFSGMNGADIALLVIDND